jgi:hypothetical protein
MKHLNRTLTSAVLLGPVLLIAAVTLVQTAVKEAMTTVLFPTKHLAGTINQEYEKCHSSS